MATIKRNFRSNLVNILSKEGLRPNMQAIEIKNGFIYGSDGHVGLKQKLELHDLHPEDIENLEGKCIHSSVLKLLKQHDWVEFLPDTIKAKIRNTFSFVNYPYYQPDGLMPDLERVLNSSIENNKDLPELKIGVNPELLNRLYGAMVKTSNGVCMDMFGPNKSILITAFEHRDQVGIIMPVNFADAYVYRPLKSNAA